MLFLWRDNMTTSNLNTISLKQSDNISLISNKTSEFEYVFCNDIIAEYIYQKQHHIGAVRMADYKRTNNYLHGGFHSATYAFPSETSVGKSALMQNYMEKAIQNGCYVLFVCLEMSHFEYIDRSVSSISFQSHLKDSQKQCYKFSDLDSESDFYDEIADEFTHIPCNQYKEYVDVFVAKFSNKLAFMTTANGKITVPIIRNAVQKFKLAYPGEKLMVIIDYLQLIHSEDEDKTYQTEDRLSIITSQLQNMAITEKIPILFPASVAKATVGELKSATGIKGSVDASYSAAYVMPYEWLGVTYTTNKNEIISEKKKCNQRGYRIMWLNPQKGRSSANGGDGIFYKYYPAYNYIEEIDFEEIKSEYGHLFGVNLTKQEAKFYNVK